jgi:hypothetical protein
VEERLGIELFVERGMDEPSAKLNQAGRTTTRTTVPITFG